MSPRTRLMVMLLLLAVAGVCAVHQGGDNVVAAVGAAQAAAVILWSLALTASPLDGLPGSVHRLGFCSGPRILVAANRPGLVALLC